MAMAAIGATWFLTSGCSEEPAPANPPVAGAAATNTARVFTCSMHPEVVSNAPGACPKCGMTLVPKP